MQELIDAFTQLYFSKSSGTTWAGVPTQKCPLDMWMYQILIHKVQPEIIVECGTADGGSALFMAHVLDSMGPRNSEIVTVDIIGKPRPRHGRITYLTGSSVDPCLVNDIAAMARGRRAMVILDSDHHTPHVLAEMRAYSPLVSVGSYMIVEDTVVHHPLKFADYPEGGPWKAVEAFMRETDDFEHDNRCEQFMLTYHPGGYLLRMRMLGQ